jgi:hypothetical protein
MDAGDREYAGAVAGMQEVYGKRMSQSRGVLRNGRVVPTWSAGDYITWTDDQGEIRQGYVIEVLCEDRDGTYHVKEHKRGGGTEHWSVDGHQIRVM